MEVVIPEQLPLDQFPEVLLPELLHLVVLPSDMEAGAGVVWEDGEDMALS